MAGDVSLGDGGDAGVGIMGGSDDMGLGWVSVMVNVVVDVNVAGGATGGGAGHPSVCSSSSNLASEISASDTISCRGGVCVNRDREIGR